ncbi:MAG: AtpZ/AtpI family protein [Candidatus Binatia bacterium]
MIDTSYVSENSRGFKGKGSNRHPPAWFNATKYIAIGLQFPSMVLGGLALGYLMDLYLGTSPWLTAGMTLLALVGAFVQLIRTLQYLSGRKTGGRGR